MGGSGLALFERSEFSQTPPDASSARKRKAPLAAARLFFAYFILAKQKKVRRCRSPPAYKIAASSNSTQCFTGVCVPLCKWVMQPMLAETMTSGFISFRFPSLRSRSW